MGDRQGLSEIVPLMAAQERPQSAQGPVVFGGGEWSGGDVYGVWAHGYLCAIGALKGYNLASRNGQIGTVKEFYFDDRYWTIRYLVAETGNWLTDRQVLISPYALIAVNREDRQIAVNLTQEQIEGSPSLNSDKPVSRRFEEAYNGYYGWPIYWNGRYAWGSSPYMLGPDCEKWEKSIQGEKAWKFHLRSMRDVRGHYIQATDGEIGHVEDFIIDDQTWAMGTVVSVRGSVVDIRFDTHLPPIYTVLRAERKNKSSSKCWRSAMRVTCAGLR
jgi:hypothetical protein